MGVRIPFPFAAAIALLLGLAACGGVPDSVVVLLPDEDGSVGKVEIVNDDGYIGERYGIVSPAGREALLLAARTEGLILDPVYTSKALAGLIDHRRRGLVGPEDVVVFVHTGGTPAVFAYGEDLLAG